MSKYGRKYSCWSCAAKFYDLNKPSPKCPKCGADPNADPAGGITAMAVTPEDDTDDPDLADVDIPDDGEDDEEEEEDA